MDNGTIAIISSLVILPGMILGFIYLMKKHRHDVELINHKKELLELEVRKEELRLQNLVEENRKYDRIIDGRNSRDGS
jgi:hypothetical protein